MGQLDSRGSYNSGDRNQAERATVGYHPRTGITYREGRLSFRPLVLSLAGLYVLALGLGCSTGSILQGSVSATTNPQVAIYTVTPQEPGDVTIYFGTTTSYGLQ